ncbi:MAG: hemerythrin domain-containing protein [Isosphaeraceae bacterium]
MDALTFLRQQHESVLGMLEVLDVAPRGDGARVSGLETVVENLIIAESRHEAIEEQWFWPAVRKALGDGDQLADQGIGQEDDGKKLLQTLLDGKPGEASYDDALEKFVAAAREHIDYEQQVVWPRFESAVSRDELERLGQRLEQAHKIAPTRPHPHTPSSSVVQKTMGVVAATVDRVVDAATGRDKNHPPDPPKP